MSALEDIFAGPSSPFERIDLIFARNLEILDVGVVGNIPLFPSDHAGVVQPCEQKTAGTTGKTIDEDKSTIQQKIADR